MSRPSLSVKRIENLSDGIFAIVMTLLVLQIAVPVGIQKDLFGYILNQWPHFLSFFLSFIVLGIFWVEHQNETSYVKKTNKAFLWLNIIFFMFISLVPFTTSLLGQYPFERASVLIYGANIILCSLFMHVIWYYTLRHHLEVEILHHKSLRDFTRKLATGPIFYMIGIAVSFIHIPSSLILFVIPIVLHFINARRDNYFAS